MMKVLVLSTLAGWVIGIILLWLKIPLLAPPVVGLLGLAGMTLGGLVLLETSTFPDLLSSSASVSLCLLCL